MRLTITMDLDNAAFNVDDRESEIMRAIQCAVHYLHGDAQGEVCVRDVNGNVVGKATISE